MFLEFGASDRVLINLMCLGLSRTSAILLKRTVSLGSDMTLRNASDTSTLSISHGLRSRQFVRLRFLVCEVDQTKPKAPIRSSRKMSYELNYGTHDLGAIPKMLRKLLPMAWIV